jgi:hypothetical protein
VLSPIAQPLWLWCFVGQLLWVSGQVLSGAAAAQVDCLEGHEREGSPGYNELALYVLDTLVAVAGHMGDPKQQRWVHPQLQLQQQQSTLRLLRQLSRLLRCGSAPLRLRSTAAAALSAIAGSPASQQPFIASLGECPLTSGEAERLSVKTHQSVCSRTTCRYKARHGEACTITF